MVYKKISAELSLILVYSNMPYIFRDFSILIPVKNINILKLH